VAEAVEPDSEIGEEVASAGETSDGETAEVVETTDESTKED
jgi:hypothetical protein